MDVLAVRDRVAEARIEAAYAFRESFYVVVMQHHRIQIEVLMFVENHRQRIAHMMNLNEIIFKC